MAFFLLQILFLKKKQICKFGFFSAINLDFFWRKKNQIRKFANLVFFQKKNPNLKEKKKPRKKFSKLKFGFFHMDGPIVRNVLKRFKRDFVFKNWWSLNHQWSSGVICGWFLTNTAEHTTPMSMRSFKNYRKHHPSLIKWPNWRNDWPFRRHSFLESTGHV